MERHEFTVDPDSVGLRLDVYLAGLLPQHSRSQLQRVIKDGGATVRGRAAKPNAALKAGDVVNAWDLKKVERFLSSHRPKG